MFIGIVAWLHIARPDVDPMARGISRYAIGPHGSAISMAFAMLAFAIGIAAWLLDRPAQAGAFRWHARCLWCAVAGLLVVIVWPLRSPSAGTAEDWLHQGGGAVFFAATAAGVQAIPKWLARANGLGALAALARACSLMSVVTVVVFFVSAMAPGTSLEAIRGLLQRGCFASLSGCLTVLGLGLLIRPAQHASPRRLMKETRTVTAGL